MKIKKILRQSRRDFVAIFVCCHCNNEVEMNGYDDNSFHIKVIPEIKCKECGKKEGDDYRALQTKYPDGFQI